MRQTPLGRLISRRIDSPGFPHPTIKAVAEAASISRQMLYYAANGTWGLSDDYVERLANVLQVKPATIRKKMSEARAADEMLS